MLITEGKNKLNISFTDNKAPDISLWKDVFGTHAKIGNVIYGDSVEVNLVADYLYEITYTDYDYADADRVFDEFNFKVGACSGVRYNNWYGRNYDWYYSNTPTMIVRTTAKDSRHASIGIASNDNITNDIAKNKEYNEAYLILPFTTLDGINDAGVVCSTNVVPIDKGLTVGTNPGKPNLCQISIPRMILDYADSALDGIKKLSKYNIWSPAKRIGSELHVMVADKDSTYIIEFLDNKLHILSDLDDEYDDIPNDKAIMTNFHLSDWNGDVKAVFLGDDEESVKSTGLEEHAEGIERYKILSDNIESCLSINDTLNVMNKVLFTRCYSDEESPIWYSECTGKTDTFGDLTIYNIPEDFTGIRDYMKELYYNRDRNRPDSWQTVHSSAYDINNKEFSVKIQEEDIVYNFRLN